MAINDEALDTIFRTARTHHKWQAKPVSPALLMAIYDLMRWGPTAANISPLRLVYVVSKEAKEKLKPHLDAGNVDQTMSAPVTAILGYDLDFVDQVERLFPVPGVKSWFADPQVAEYSARLSGGLQGGYFIVAARALGLDCGSMGGFNRQGVDKAFFAGTNIKSSFLCNLGYGDPKGLYPRGPRLAFDEACRIV